ncbi:MAG: transposase [Gammaproteobacteria bacterium]|nr:transposase [Gammaproteobacteria bacterium]
MHIGLFDLPWWGYLLVTLGLTHITIAGVTIFLHRHQAHRALNLHPIVSHFFRFWLWLTTGMITKEWAAIHRKHHAKCETVDDPHSPQIFGIKKVMWQGAELYKKEAADRETLSRYGHGTPNDWLETHIYEHNNYGIGLMLIINVILFGPIGLSIWAIQMMWIPFFAAGVINGIGHFWGYRNFEAPDASKNIIPWGILIGGEELHNNHHTYPSSAKLSSKWWEFDLGWLYIKTLKLLRLAEIKRVPPQPVYDVNKKQCDMETVKAVIANRFQIMSRFAREVLNNVHREELKKANPKDKEHWVLLKKARRLMVRESALLDDRSRKWLHKILEENQALETVYAMKSKLQDIWQRSATSQENLLKALDDWCKQAEETRIQALKDFSQKLRTYTLIPAEPTLV